MRTSTLRSSSVSGLGSDPSISPGKWGYDRHPLTGMRVPLIFSLARGRTLSAQEPELFRDGVEDLARVDGEDLCDEFAVHGAEVHGRFHVAVVEVCE